jgi:hypothetical protein
MEGKPCSDVVVCSASQRLWQVLQKMAAYSCGQVGSVHDPACAHARQG